MSERVVIRSTATPRLYSAFLVFLAAAVGVKFMWDAWRPSATASALTGVALLLGLPVAAFLIERHSVVVDSNGLVIGALRRRRFAWRDVSYFKASEYITYGHWFNWARLSMGLVGERPGKTILLTKSYRNTDEDLLRILECAPPDDRRRYIQKLRDMHGYSVAVMQRFPDELGGQ